VLRGFEASRVAVFCVTGELIACSDLMMNCWEKIKSKSYMRNKLNQVIDGIELSNDVIRITSLPFEEYSMTF